jgi:hypothetical protein
MGKKGFASRLPQDLREELDRQIVDGKLSVDELWTWLRGRGVDVGRSSVHRHMQNVEEVAAEVRQAREAASAIVGQLGPEAAEGKVGQLLVEVVQNIAWKIARDTLLNPAGPSLDMEQLMFLTSAVQKLTSAQKTDTDRRMKIEEAALKQAAARVDKVARASGWSAETAALVRSEILGIKLDPPASEAP